jgi:hypothetical protein
MTERQQRLEALERANEIGHARAELKRRIQAGERSAADVILDCPPEASRWPVEELLAVLPPGLNVIPLQSTARDRIGAAARHRQPLRDLERRD